MTRMDRLIGHQFRIRPFKELTIPYQLAMTYYMAIDGEAWDLTCDCLTARLDAEILKRELISVRKRYGETLFGTALIPTKRLIEAVLQDEYIAQNYPNQEAYLADLLNNWEVPEHPRTQRRPVILSSSDEETLQDGWHRFNCYVRDKHRTIPAIFYPKPRHLRAVGIRQ